MSGIIGRFRGELRGSEQHAVELEHELVASRAHAKQLEARLHALQAAASHVDHSKPIPRHGVDYAWHGPLDPGALRRAGVTFALRYLGPSPGEGKALSDGEARALGHAGIDVGAIFETSGNTAGGEQAGRRDGELAKEWARGVVPAGRPIYFTNDREAVDGLAGYLTGAASVLGHHATGVYGGIAAIRLAANEHLCAYYWQTYAWSAGQWHAAAQLRQTQNGVRVAGIDCDLDEARAADFGQWRG